MTNRKDHNPVSEFDQIPPAKIEITPRSFSAAPEFQAQPRKTAGQGRGASHSFKLYASLAGLLTVAAAVFLLLPRLVPEPVLREPASVAASNVPGLSTPALSPWQEAQAARAREEAQSILEQMLDRRFQLEELRVTSWAAEDFAAALAQADEGDAAYRQRDFSAAIAHYRDGVAAMERLLASVDRVVEDLLARGEAAIAEGSVQAAQSAFEQVLNIRPAQDRAVIGLARAATLDQVSELRAMAQRQQEAGQLEEALASYKEALRLDARTPGLAQAMQNVESRIVERNFARRMSAGFTALSQGRQQEAIQAFEQALALQPGSVEAKDGLEQAALHATQEQVERHRAEAERLLAQEAWRAAEAEFQAALKLDSSLIFAQEGARRAGVRARLDELLEQSLAQPARLNTEAVRQETHDLLGIARKVEDPGTRLQRQIAELERLLQLLQAPVPVTITSDNQTEVTLYKVGPLGTFSSQTLNLIPGSYAIVGKRPGYRDVRHEFEVSFNQEPPAIRVQCTEKI